MKFRDLNIGDEFVFESEVWHPHWGLARGPWVKTSPRKYDRIINEEHGGYPLVNVRVGSINTTVVLTGTSTKKGIE